GTSASRVFGRPSPTRLCEARGAKREQASLADRALSTSLLGRYRGGRCASLVPGPSLRGRSDRQRPTRPGADGAAFLRRLAARAAHSFARRFAAASLSPERTADDPPSAARPGTQRRTTSPTYTYSRSCDVSGRSSPRHVTRSIDATKSV